MTAPIPTDLDQAVLDTGEALIDAELAEIVPPVGGTDAHLRIGRRHSRLGRPAVSTTADLKMPPAGPGQEDAVLSMLLDSMREVKEQVVRLETHLSARLDSLDQRYLPRSEYEARHSDLRAVAAKTDARVDAAVAGNSARIDALEEKLSAARRFAVTSSIAGLVFIVGLLALILSHVH